MTDEECLKCTAEQDCGEHVADWEQLTDYWKNNAQTLTAENERLRKALGHIALGFTIELDEEDGPVQVWLDDEDMSSLARAALEKKP
jgi:hypothetical protein